MIVFTIARRVVLLSVALFCAIAPAMGAVTIDATRFADSSTAATNITTAAFSTTAPNELLLAFISTDARTAGVNITSVTTTGLTWTLVRRTNAQMGTAEIWRAFATTALTNATVRANISQSVSASITVVSFTGVDPSTPVGNSASASAASGAPTASLTTSRAGAWVFGVGTDWDNPVNRTVGPNQTIVHQYLPTVGDSYWVQRQNSPTPTANTLVTINDTAPTADRYNLSIVEVLPPAVAGPTFSITGALTPAANGAGTTLTITQGAATLATATADANGNYSTNGLPDGTYTVTPGKAGFAFSPTSLNVTIAGANAVANFTATAVPVTRTISGTVSPAASGSGTTLTLSGAASATATANSSGAYSFSGLADGSYTVTPAKAGFTFSPASFPVTIAGANATANFTATANPTLRTISGTVSPAAVGNGATVALSGAASATTTANASGAFSFTGLSNGDYTVTPAKLNNSFTPVNRAVTIINANVTGVNFAAVTYSITGTISPAAQGSGTTVRLSGTSTATVTANASGVFTFSGLANGSYSVTPAKDGVAFTPAAAAVTILGSSQAGVNFAATAQTANYPDLSVIVPPNQISVSGTGADKIFLYTHDTFNGGRGPLQIQPIYNEASGNYQGYQEVLRLQGGNWSVDHTSAVAGAFVFHPVHGHFHFPFASFGLYARNPDGSIGAAVALSPKVGFCIANSFIYDASLPNAGYGTWGSCDDPTSLRGLSIGAVDEYDYRDDGQSIPIPNLPDGTYWLRSFADPEGLLEESNETNNETDLELTITGNSVNVIRTVVPVLTPEPVVSLATPLDQSQVSGTIDMTATSPAGNVASVRFLVDGLPYGSPVTTPPYTVPLLTAFLQNGEHWVAAQATDSVGRTGTSRVAFVTINNTSSTPPSIQISEPETGEVVSAVVNVGAVAVAQSGVPTVRFFVDGQLIGSPDSTPPFMVQWNTTAFSAGEHVVTATATDSLGNVGDAEAVTVTVDNSHPANTISIDATVFRDTQDTMTTPAFSTTTPSDLLVAFVAYDGPPAGTPQTATVTGAGLTWTLVKRSNAQAGTSEIWSAKAASVLTNVTVTSQPSRAGFHGSLTVVAFKNASGPGVAGQASAQTGAPDIYLPGIDTGNWVFAVGNDWDGATARTPVAGQTLVHQRVDTSVGDTFWVQSTTAPSTSTGLVTIHDNAPTNHQWNYAAVEIVATRQ
jgi:hypothetical protein